MRLQFSDLRFVPTGVAYLASAARTAGPPIFFTIETVNQCNLRCVYCPQSRPEEHFPNGRGRMSLAQFEHILDRLEEAFQPRLVSLHRDGEPLLNPEIDRFVARATARGIKVSFSTNGTLLTPELSRRLLAAGLRMINSDFCADPAQYESLRVRARWERTREGITSLLEAADEIGAPLRVVIKDLGTTDPDPAVNQRALAATRALFLRHSARVHVVPIHFHNALRQSARDLSAARDATEEGAYHLCHQPWVSMTIDWAGRVVGCCRDLRSEVVLGNLLEQSAWDIWNGEAARTLRRALAERRPEDVATCRSCDLPRHGSYSGTTKLDRIGSFLFSRTHSQA